MNFVVHRRRNGSTFADIGRAGGFGAQAARDDFYAGERIERTERDLEAIAATEHSRDLQKLAGCASAVAMVQWISEGHFVPLPPKERILLVNSLSQGSS